MKPLFLFLSAMLVSQVVSGTEDSINLVSMTNIIVHPERFNGKRISLTGYLHGDSGQYELCLFKEPPSKMECLHIDTSIGVSKKILGTLKQNTGGSMMVQATFSANDPVYPMYSGVLRWIIPINSSKSRDKDLDAISLIHVMNVINNPGKFDGKRIRIRGHVFKPSGRLLCNFPYSDADVRKCLRIDRKASEVNEERRYGYKIIQAVFSANDPDYPMYFGVLREIEQEWFEFEYAD